VTQRKYPTFVLCQNVSLICFCHKISGLPICPEKAFQDHQISNVAAESEKLKDTFFATVKSVILSYSCAWNE